MISIFQDEQAWKSKSIGDSVVTKRGAIYTTGDDEGPVLNINVDEPINIDIDHDHDGQKRWDL